MHIFQFNLIPQFGKYVGLLLYVLYLKYIEIMVASTLTAGDHINTLM